MSKLKLGALPDDKPIKVTIALSAELHGLLLAYAEAIAVEGGGSVAPVERLIPPMLDRFVRSDRVFLRLRNRVEPPPPPIVGSARES